MPAIKGNEWTFDTVAENYEKMRPGYPRELYDDIFKCVRLDSSCSAVEVGIGGGQATEPVLMTGCMVTAVEPGKNMRELCNRKFSSYPNFRAINMKFEEYECESCSCDLVFSASAFHWIPEESGYTKVFNMLRSGGVFARFANHPFGDKGRGELWNEIQKLYAIYMPGSTAPAEYTSEDAGRRADIASKYGFTNIGYRLYYRQRSFSSQEYTDLLNTYSDHIVLADNIKREFYSGIRGKIDKYGGRITIYDTIDLQLAGKP